MDDITVFILIAIAICISVTCYIIKINLKRIKELEELRERLFKAEIENAQLEEALEYVKKKAPHE